MVQSVTKDHAIEALDEGKSMTKPVSCEDVGRNRTGDDRSPPHQGVIWWELTKDKYEIRQSRDQKTQVRTER